MVRFISLQSWICNILTKLIIRYRWYWTHFLLLTPILIVWDIQIMLLLEPFVNLAWDVIIIILNSYNKWSNHVKLISSCRSYHLILLMRSTCLFYMCLYCMQVLHLFLSNKVLYIYATKYYIHWIYLWEVYYKKHNASYCIMCVHFPCLWLKITLYNDNFDQITINYSWISNDNKCCLNCSYLFLLRLKINLFLCINSFLGWSMAEQSIIIILYILS